MHLIYSIYFNDKINIITIMKSKSTAYILWFFFGILGIHKFYLGKVGWGIAYFFTLGFLGVGVLVDLFTLGGQVDTYNLLHQGQFNVHNIVVNVPQQHAPKGIDVSEQLQKLSELKEKGVLSDEEFASQKSKILS